MSDRDHYPGGPFPETRSLVEFTLHGTHPLKMLVDPAEVAMLMEESPGCVSIWLKGSGFCGGVAGTWGDVRARLWPDHV